MLSELPPETLSPPAKLPPMATLTIRLDSSTLKALRRAERGTTVTATAAAGDGETQAKRPRAKAKAAKASRGKRVRPKGTGTLREGSHAARLVAWASTRAKPFSTPDAAKALKITRNHATMVLAEAVRRRAVVREARGVYRTVG